MSYSEIARFAHQPPSEREVKAAGRSLGRAFPLLYESVAAQAVQWLGGRFHALGDDYVERYPERVQTVTAAEVQAAAAQWLVENREVLVVVGAASVLEPKLREFGTVQVVPITAPPTNMESAPAMRMVTPNAGDLARGRKLIDQAVVEIGRAHV